MATWASFLVFAAIQQTTSYGDTISIEDSEALYTVNIYQEDLDGNYSFSSSILKTGNIGKTVYPNVSTPTGFNLNSDHEDSVLSTILAPEDSFLNVYFARNIYSLTYVYNDGVTPNGIDYYKYGATPSVRSASRAYYTFAEWSSANSYSPVDQDVTLIAQWNPFTINISYQNFGPGNKGNGTITASFPQGGSTAAQTITYNSGGTLSANGFTLGCNVDGAASASGSGTFMGWSFTGGNSGDKVYNGISDITIDEYNYDVLYTDRQDVNSVIEDLITNRGYENGVSIILRPVWDITPMNISGCLVEGTLIKTSLTESKPVEELAVGESILIWNHNTGTYDYAPVILIQKTQTIMDVGYLIFDDGTRIGIVYGHSFFSVEENKYVDIYVTDIAKHIGKSFYKINGDGTLSVHQLIAYERYREETSCYGIVTGQHYNHFANGFISAVTYTPLFNMFEFAGEHLQIDQARKQADIELYGLLDYEVWKPYLTYDEYIMFNAKYMSVAIGKGLITFEDIVDIILKDFPRSEIDG